MHQLVGEHRLRRELHELLSSDPRVLDFLEQGSLDGIWFWDLERPDEEWMSPRFWTLMGRDPAVMPHQASAWQDLIHPDDLREALRNFEAHCADPDHPYDQMVRYRHADGRWVTVRCRGLAIRDDAGRPIRMLGAHTDLTALVSSRQDLIERNGELEAARDAALAAARAKSAFLATMSHEVRTPLNGILGMAEALSLTRMAPEQAAMVEVLRTSGRDLTALLDEILDYSRIEAGMADLDPTEHDPRASAEHVAELFLPTARAKGLRLSVSLDAGLPRRIMGAERAIRQVMSNLVSNAIKFTDAGRVSLSLWMEGGPGSETLVAEVADTGRGVPPEMRAAIFGRFHKGPDADGTGPRGEVVAGSGLGLAIVSRLCALHGGDVRVGDTPGGGATFTARVKVAPPAAAATKTPAEEPATAVAALARAVDLPRMEAPLTGPPPAAPALRILVAEDTEVNRLVIAAMLEPEPVEIVFAHDGREALERLEEGGLDGALIDVRMPVMDGETCARVWREREAAAGREPLPLIACSADAMADQVVRHLAGGFDRHLPKPLNLAALSETIRWLAARRDGVAEAA